MLCSVLRRMRMGNHNHRPSDKDTGEDWASYFGGWNRYFAGRGILEVSHLKTYHRPNEENSGKQSLAVLCFQAQFNRFAGSGQEFVHRAGLSVAALKFRDGRHQPALFIFFDYYAEFSSHDGSFRVILTSAAAQ